MLLLSSKKLRLTTAHIHACATAEAVRLITGFETITNKSYGVRRELWTMECQASEGMLYPVQEIDAVMQLYSLLFEEVTSTTPLVRMHCFKNKQINKRTKNSF